MEYRLECRRNARDRWNETLKQPQDEAGLKILCDALEDATYEVRILPVAETKYVAR